MIKILLSLFVISSLLAVDDISYTTKTYRSIGTQTVGQYKEESVSKPNVGYKESAFDYDAHYSKNEYLKRIGEILQILQRENKSHSAYYKVLKTESLNGGNVESHKQLLNLAEACVGLHQSEELESVFLQCYSEKGIDGLIPKIEKIALLSGDTSILYIKYEQIKKIKKSNTDCGFDIMRLIEHIYNETFYHQKNDNSHLGKIIRASYDNIRDTLQTENDYFDFG